MRGLALAAGVALLTLAGAGAAAAQAANATWRFAPAVAPPPPTGAQPAPYPVPLGHVGQISFWAPTRGLLITAGTNVVPMGLYAYDGVYWHQLSTVCGGSDGRIAWAGPNEWWTIADQRPAQATPAVARLENVSLCHFKDGQVVGSYAMPLQQPNSYRRMTAAACRAPNDCWFGGITGTAPDTGAFHLHWDGTSVSAVASAAGHDVADMATVQSQLFESVRFGPNDTYADGEDPDHPTILHKISPLATVNPFQAVVPTNASCVGQVICPPLPTWGTDANGRPVAPSTLSAFRLGTDAGAAGASPTAPQLWVAAGVPGFAQTPPTGKGIGHPIVLRLSGTTWTQMAPPTSAIPTTADIAAVAPDPGQPAAWFAIRSSSGDGSARVARITADGTVTDAARLGPDQNVGARGSADKLVCPATNDCWLVTDAGWLFHLTDGQARLQDTDPSFQQIITYRPPDGGVPQLPPDLRPPDDSLANQAAPPPPAATPTPTPTAKPSKPRRLVTEMRKPRILHRHTLDLRFRLTAGARVQLIAKRHGTTVAKTKRRTLKKGRHSVRLTLNPRRWPTKLDLKATPLNQQSASSPTGDDTVISS